MFIQTQFEIQNIQSEGYTPYEWDWPQDGDHKYELIGIFESQEITHRVFESLCRVMKKCDLTNERFRRMEHNTTSLSAIRIERITGGPAENKGLTLCGLFVRESLPFWIKKQIDTVIGTAQAFFDDSRYTTIPFEEFLQNEQELQQRCLMLLEPSGDSLSEMLSAFGKLPYTWPLKDTLEHSMFFFQSFSLEKGIWTLVPAWASAAIIPIVVGVSYSDVPQLIHGHKLIIRRPIGNNSD